MENLLILKSATPQNTAPKIAPAKTATTKVVAPKSTALKIIAPKIIDLELGCSEPQIACGTVHTAENKYVKPGCFLLELTLVDETGFLRATWFNKPEYLEVFLPNKTVCLQGVLKYKYGCRQMEAPEIVEPPPINGERGGCEEPPSKCVNA